MKVPLAEQLILVCLVTAGSSQAVRGNGTEPSPMTDPDTFGRDFAIGFVLAHIPFCGTIGLVVGLTYWCCRKRRRRLKKAKLRVEATAPNSRDELKNHHDAPVQVQCQSSGSSNPYTNRRNALNDRAVFKQNRDSDPPPSYSPTNNKVSDNYHLIGSYEFDEDAVTSDTDTGSYTLLSTPDDYEEAYKNLNKDYEHDYEEPFWEPATQEEELCQQLIGLCVVQIPKEKLELHQHIGRGEFGTVHRGVWHHSSNSTEQPGEDEEVAVKSMKSGASEEERVKFLQEAAIMGQFNHPNILRILGFIPDDPLMIVVDIMQFGDLRNHLPSLKPSPDEPSELSATLLSYSRQVAFGMMYLSFKLYIHRDLAARNVLVSNNGTCKIADFGLSRVLHDDEDHYVSHGGKVPVKWTAPEALHYRKYSTASDVWSYGCLLYEIWSLGSKPFAGCPNSQALQKVSVGYRLPPPPGCPRAIYQIMIKCWNPDPDKRPNFLNIVVLLQHPDFQILKWSNRDNATSSEHARTLGAPLKEGNSLYKDLQRTYLTHVGERIVTRKKTEENIEKPDHNQAPSIDLPSQQDVNQKRQTVSQTGTADQSVDEEQIDNDYY